MDEDEGIYSWGTRAQLPELVIYTLMEQGFNCVSELCQLNEEDLDTYFLATELLSEEQCSALMAALMTLPASLLAVQSNTPDRGHQEAASAAKEHTPPRPTVQGRTVSSHLPHMHGDDDDNDDDIYNEEEFEHIHASLAAAVVCEEAPREHCGPLQTRSAPGQVTRGAWGLGACTADDGHSQIGDLETVRLLLAGKTGNGKSTTGNTILGQELFDTAPDFGSVTCECERRVAVNRSTRMEVMDTPGLYDTNKTHEEICTIIVQAVAGMHPGPHAILFVIKVGRFTPEEHAAYRRLKALFDDSITRHIILLFTHGDYLEKEGKTLQDLMRSPRTPDNLREVFEECGHRCLVFNNRAEDPDPQVDALLRQVQTVVDINGSRPYTCPKYSKIGEGLEEEVNKRMEAFEKKDLQRQKYVQQLEQQSKDAETAAKLVRQEFDEMEQQRQREMEREDRQRRRMEEKLQRQLRQQKDHTEKQRQEMEQLKKDVKRKKKEQERLQKEHEKKREQQLREMDNKNKALERERQRAREEDKRRDRARAEEMERLKSSVVQKKEQGFLSKAVDFVASPIKKFFGLFGL